MKFFIPPPIPDFKNDFDRYFTFPMKVIQPKCSSLHLVQQYNPRQILQNYQTHILETAKLMCKLAEIDNIRIVFKNVKSYGGKAFLPGKDREIGYISVSNLRIAKIDNMYYDEALIIHEICHFLYWHWYKTSEDAPVRADHHGAYFRTLEKFWLLNFGMIPIYGGKYPHTLLNAGDEILWSNRYPVPSSTGTEER